VATIPSILLVDDDVALCELLVEYLGVNGYAVDCEHDGAAGLKRALDAHYDLVILDVMLPKLAGFDVLRRLRQRATLPIIMHWVVPLFTRISPVEASILACVGGTGLGLAMCRVPIEAGSDVAVFGLGPIGVSAVQGARIQGAKTIIGSPTERPFSGVS